jgi:hypothetical protein
MVRFSQHVYEPYAFISVANFLKELNKYDLLDEDRTTKLVRSFVRCEVN